jgi:pimeloyl-ACP methyl ester carboxylesterase
VGRVVWSEVEIDSASGPIAAMDWGGAGDPLLLLHGGGANAAEWAPLVAHLNDHFRCISFDSFGHGRTPATGRPTFDLLLGQVSEVIEHFRLPRHRLTLVGGSFGGALAVCFEALHPGCHAVVGLDSMPTAVHVGLRPNPDGVEHSAQHYEAQGWGWSGDHAGYLARVAEWVAEGDPEPYARRAHQQGADGRYHAVPSPAAIAALHNLGLRPDNPFARVENYADVRCPVLLLCATDGMAGDNRAFVDSMPQRFPMVTVTWLEGGHGLGREHPETVALHIRGFLSELDASSRA